MPPANVRVQLFARQEAPSSPTLRLTAPLLTPPEHWKKIVSGSGPSSCPDPRHSILQTPHPKTTTETDRRTRHRGKKFPCCEGLRTELVHVPGSGSNPRRSLLQRNC